MERSEGRFGRLGAGARTERLRDVVARPWEPADEARLPVALLVLLAGEIVAFAALAASGNMPGVVTVLYRALLTL